MKDKKAFSKSKYSVKHKIFFFTMITVMTLAGCDNSLQDKYDSSFSSKNQSMTKNESFDVIQQETELQHAIELLRQDKSEQAFPLFINLSKQGNGKAQLGLAMMYESGLGTQKNIPAAIHWYEKAASQKVVEAYYALGGVYLHGRSGVPKNIEKAVSLFQLGAENGDTKAMHTLGSIYFKGIESIQPDKNMAFKYYERGANLGDKDLQFVLGLMYYEGETPQANRDMVQAKYWIQKAADNKHKSAQEFLNHYLK